MTYEIAGSRVLVTGGAGFVGSHIVDLLDRLGATERARERIGFATEVSLREGLRALVAWRRAAMRELQEVGA